MTRARSASSRSRRFGRLGRPAASPLLALLLLIVTAACGDDGLAPPAGDAREVGVVLNSLDVSVSVFPLDSPQVVRPPIGLAPDGSPVGLSIRGELAAVPLGFVPALVVVDLEAGTVLRTVSLPQGSGATGSAFVDDSTVLVANPNRDTVVPVNVLRGTVGDEIPVGGFPQSVLISGDRILVLNAELGPDFLPTGPGTVSVLDRQTLSVVGTVTLSGTNPGGGVVAPDGRVFVVTSGSFGAGEGSVSLVDPSLPAEVGHWTGFGEFPSGAALGADGLLHVSSFAYGVAVWDPATETFVRPPDDAVAPEGVPSVSGLGFDDDGRLYTLRPECAAPSVVNRLDAGFSVEGTWGVGTCPIGIGFTDLGG